VLQVYGLAARHPGTPVENPRQVSAWRYPRQYGPTAPTFARGMRSAATQCDPADAAIVAATLHAQLPALAGLLVLAGDICRSELLVEVDGVHRLDD
jgi:chorismate lyase/3-hydroxybenzoate synthase